MLKTIKETIKEIGVLSVGFTLAFIIFISLSIANAWTDPTQAPPAGNLGAPINTSSIQQYKAGNLRVEGFRNFGPTVLDGKVGIGTMNPTQQLDVYGTIKSTGLQIATSAGVGKVLTSDANGNATWKTAASGGGATTTTIASYDDLPAGAMAGFCYITRNGAVRNMPITAPAVSEYNHGAYCTCKSGFTLIQIGDATGEWSQNEVGGITPDGTIFYSCIKD